MKLDEVETVEEITYTEAPPSEWETRRRRSKLESVDSEPMISVSQEERKRYLVAAVNDPRDENNKLSLEQATNEGIIHYPTGRYLNPDTGQGQRPFARLISTFYISISYAIMSFGEVFRVNRL